MTLRGFGRDFWRIFWAASKGFNVIKVMGFLTLFPFPKRPLRVRRIYSKTRVVPVLVELLVPSFPLISM